MNTIENNNISGLPAPPCTIITSSTANLNLNPADVIQSAYLYWAGSGTGDFDVKLNGEDITPDRTFAINNSIGMPCFAAFKDVTTLVQTTGNGDYTLSDLDLTDVIPDYCFNGGNFAGWAIVIVYGNPALPINQINIYDGMQAIPSTINIILNSLNVIDNNGAKIGFIAWEGDKNISENETLRINGNILSNALNPPNNAFNGTNTFTGSDTLYNMDLDVYDIQNNIAVGDATATVQLTSSQDFVMINAVVTKLNSELPDATIAIDNIQKSCGSREIVADYTVYNLNSTDVLPANTPIAVYANTTLIGTTHTTTILPVGGSESGTITLTIPASIPANFTLNFKVDDIGNGTGTVAEIIENNNTATLPVSLLVLPQFNPLENIFSCVSSLTTVSFDLSSYATSVLVNPSDTVQFFTSMQDAENNVNPIPDITNFTVNAFTTTVYIRLDNGNCHSITSFDINLVLYPSFNPLADISICKENETSSFNFSDYENLVKVTATDLVHFYASSQDANLNVNPILNTSNYIPTATPMEIFVRIENEHCQSYTSFTLDYYDLPKFNLLDNLVSCNEGLTKGTFDFSGYETTVLENVTDQFAGFYTSFSDAENQINAVSNPSNYVAEQTPKEIFVRVENEHCYNITSFNLNVRNCPPTVYNFISSNGDGVNDTFFIAGLRDIFLNFQLEIYNRWGRMIWTGNNNTPDWDGYSNNGYRFDDKRAPTGTYFYILHLNDEGYPEPLVGYLYFVKQL